MAETSPIYKFRYDGFEKITQDVWVAHSNGQVEYHGVARKGAATSDTLWWVEKFVYNGSGFCTSRVSSQENQIFDDYLTLSYS